MVALRWPIVVAWLVLVVVLASDGVPGFGRTGLTLRELAPSDAPELQTELESARLFRIPLTGRVQVVRRDGAGLDPRVVRADVEDAIDRSRAEHAQGSGTSAVAFWLPYTNAVGVLPASSETSTTTLVNVVGYPDATLHARERAADRAAAAARERGGGRVGVTGGIPAQLQAGRTIRESLEVIQLASIIVLVLITAVWFRALAPPLVVLATIAATMVLLLESLAWVATEAGVEVPAEVLPVVLVVSIGVATDYALFPLATWRRLVLDGIEPRHAVRRSIELTSPVVLTAGVTTALGASSLWFAQTSFIAAFGPALVVAVLVAMAAGLLLVPAMFAVFGSMLAWPRRTQSLRPRGAWVRWLVERLGVRGIAPVVAVVGIAALVALASQARTAPSGFNVVTGLPEDDPVSIAARDAGRGFAPGIISPTLLLVDGDGLDQRSGELAAFSRSISRMDGVAGVLGPQVVRNLVEGGGLGEIAAGLELELLADDAGSGVDAPAPGRATAQATAGALVTSDGRHARLVVVLEDDPYTGTAARRIDELRPMFEAALDDVGLEEAGVRVAGDTAIVARVVDRLDQDLLRVAAFLVPFELLVLLVFLRSLVIAFTIVASSVVTTAAALGGVALFDRTLGAGDGIAFFVPIATFVLLLSIGADYGVLMGRSLRRAARQGHTGIEQAQVAMRRVGPTIVLAGLVLASTFALLALVPVDAFTQLAVALAGGVAIDTLVVRPVLMPLLLAWWTRPRRQDT